MTANHQLSVTPPLDCVCEYRDPRAGLSNNQFNAQRRGFLGKSGLCQRCGWKFTQDEIVYLVRDYELFGDWIAVCARCADDEEREACRLDGQCKGCGQPMRTPYMRTRSNIWTGECNVITANVCSKRCEQRYRRRLQRERGSGAETRCTVCGVGFRPKRDDAKFCSSACRQWAYRRRVGP
jgi:hypothetical protein